MNFKRLWLLILSIGFILIGCRPAQDVNNDVNPDIVEAETSNARAVRIINAQQGPLSATRNATVTIEPRQESRVAAGTAGRVETINKREGQTVSAEEAVIFLDNDNLELQVRNAELNLDSARINSQKATRSSSESTIQQEQQLRTAQTNFALAQLQYEEGQALFSAGGIASTDLSNLEAQFSQAEFSLTQAQDALARSQRAKQEDLALLALQVNQAETQLFQAQDALKEAQIKAPFTGEIADIFVEEGEFIGAGSPAFRLVSTERQLGRFSLPPKDAQTLLEQGDISFRYQGLDYAARIIRRSNVSNDQRLVDITAEIYPSDNPIPAGSVAQLSYTLTLATGIQVPSSALFVERGKNFVFIVSDEEANRQEVRIIAEVSGQAVIEGIAQDTQIVSPVPADLRDGTKVRIIGAR